MPNKLADASEYWLFSATVVIVASCRCSYGWTTAASESEACVVPVSASDARRCGVGAGVGRITLHLEPPRAAVPSPNEFSSALSVVTDALVSTVRTRRDSVLEEFTPVLVSANTLSKPRVLNSVASITGTTVSSNAVVVLEFSDTVVLTAWYVVVMDSGVHVTAAPAPTGTTALCASTSKSAVPTANALVSLLVALTLVACFDVASKCTSISTACSDVAEPLFPFMAMCAKLGVTIVTTTVVLTVVHVGGALLLDAEHRSSRDEYAMTSPREYFSFAKKPHLKMPTTMPRRRRDNDDDNHQHAKNTHG